MCWILGSLSFPLTRGYGYEIWYSKLKLKGVSWSGSEAGWVGLGLSAGRILCLWAILLSSGTADLCPFFWIGLYPRVLPSRE